MRCALVAYSKVSDQPVECKVKALLLYMWRALHKSVPRATKERQGLSTYAGGLIHGAMRFNNQFTEMWRRDGPSRFCGALWFSSNAAHFTATASMLMPTYCSAML